MKSFISREQDYALRITTYLAGRLNNTPIPISEITHKLYISRNFAGRIISRLKKSGIIETTQGKLGGINLAKPPDEITIFDVLDSLGFKMRFNLCLAEDFECELISVCKFHNLFNEQEELVYNNFKKLTLTQYLFKY